MADLHVMNVSTPGLLARAVDWWQMLSADATVVMVIDATTHVDALLSAHRRSDLRSRSVLLYDTEQSTQDRSLSELHECTDATARYQIIDAHALAKLVIEHEQVICWP